LAGGTIGVEHHPFWVEKSFVRHNFFLCILVFYPFRVTYFTDRLFSISLYVLHGIAVYGTLEDKDWGLEFAVDLVLGMRTTPWPLYWPVAVVLSFLPSL
jgi:hypothetical protein